MKKECLDSLTFLEYIEGKRQKEAANNSLCKWMAEQKLGENSKRKILLCVTDNRNGNYNIRLSLYRIYFYIVLSSIPFLAYEN